MAPAENEETSLGESEHSLKAAVYYQNGPASVLQYEEVPDPVPGASEVLVRVEAISVEGGDYLNRRFVPPSRQPHIVGYQAGGTIIAVGADVHRFSVGQRIISFNWDGSHAALRAVPEEFAWRLPDEADMIKLVAVPTTFGTADDALFAVGGLKAGETVLVQGAAGGVGIAAVQLAHRAGAKVLGTAADDERLERLRSFGLDHGINYKTENIAERAKALTDGRGVDLVIDNAGGAGFSQLLDAARYGGRVVAVGPASGDLSATIPLMSVVTAGISLHGLFFGKVIGDARARGIIENHLADAESGKAVMPVARIFPLAEAAAAHEFAANGHPFGRVVMVP